MPCAIRLQDGLNYSVRAVTDSAVRADLARTPRRRVPLLPFDVAACLLVNSFCTPAALLLTLLAIPYQLHVASCAKLLWISVLDSMSKNSVEVSIIVENLDIVRQGKRAGLFTLLVSYFG